MQSTKGSKIYTTGQLDAMIFGLRERFRERDNLICCCLLFVCAGLPFHIWMSESGEFATISKCASLWCNKHAAVKRDPLVHKMLTLSICSAREISCFGFIWRVCWCVPLFLSFPHSIYKARDLWDDGPNSFHLLFTSWEIISCVCGDSGISARSDSVA